MINNDWGSWWYVWFVNSMRYVWETHQWVKKCTFYSLRAKHCSTPETEKRRKRAFDNCMEGKSRKVQRQQDITDAQQKPNLSAKVCCHCNQPLSQIKEMFNGLKRQGSILWKRGRSVGCSVQERDGSLDSCFRTIPVSKPSPPRIWGNILWYHGNYSLFCQECVCCTTDQQATNLKTTKVSRH